MINEIILFSHVKNWMKDIFYKLEINHVNLSKSINQVVRNLFFWPLNMSTPWLLSKVNQTIIPYKLVKFWSKLYYPLWFVYTYNSLVVFFCSLAKLILIFRSFHWFVFLHEIFFNKCWNFSFIKIVLNLIVFLILDMLYNGD